MWLCMKWHGAWLCGVHRTRRDGSSFMWHQPCQRCKYTTLVDIQKRAIKSYSLMQNDVRAQWVCPRAKNNIYIKRSTTITTTTAPSLISLMVSVDVKHHVYLLTTTTTTIIQTTLTNKQNQNNPTCWYQQGISKRVAKSRPSESFSQPVTQPSSRHSRYRR